MFRVSSTLKKFRYNSDVDVNVKSCVSDPIMILATLTSHSSFFHNIKECDELRVRAFLLKTFTLIKTLILTDFIADISTLITSCSPKPNLVSLYKIVASSSSFRVKGIVSLSRAKKNSNHFG